MKIIIVGAGKVGYSIAVQLSKEDNDIVIIEKDLAKAARAEDALDVMVIEGNGVRAKVLLEADVMHADLLIAVTNSDEMNMVCCLTAKRLGAKRIIARVRDPEYTDDLSLLKEILELDMVINPEEAAANEIARLVNFPMAQSIEEFAQGRVKLAELEIGAEMRIAGHSLNEIGKRTSSLLIAVVVRDGQVTIPQGDFVLQAGDQIFIIGKSKEVYRFCKECYDVNRTLKKIMILGGGRIGFYLARLLLGMGLRVKIIENNQARCHDLADRLPEALIIHADGTDEDVLKSENVEAMDAFISLTGIDEENMMASMIAMQLGVKKTVTKLNRMNYFKIAKQMGISSVISPKRITSDVITRFVRGNAVETLCKIIDGQAEIMELRAETGEKYIGVPIKELDIEPGVLLATMIRRTEVIVPRGSDVIRANDRVIAIITMKDVIITRLAQLFR